MADGEGWATGASGARVYLHSPTRRHYLAAVVAPLAWGLTSQSTSEVQVRSGWLGGPHLELRAGGAGDWEAAAVALAAGSRRYPATPPTEVAYLRRAAELGRIEAVPPPYPRLRAHGETELVRPEPPTPLDRQRDAGLAHLLPPLLATAAIDGDGAVLAAVAAALLTLADTHPHGLRFGTFSLRSHAEAFMHWAGPQADYRAAFNARLGKEASVLRQVVRDVQGGAGAGPAREWRYAFNQCLARFSGQVSARDLADVEPVMPAPARPATDSSAFHRAVAASGVVDEPPAWFAAYRLLINLFYQLLPALDVRPVQRFYLCHALAETVDDVLGETWRDRLAAVETHLATAR